MLSNYVVLYAMMAVLFLHSAQAQQMPIDPLPIDFPPIDLPPIAPPPIDFPPIDIVDFPVDPIPVDYQYSFPDVPPLEPVFMDLVPPLSLCPAGFFTDLLTCKPCPRGMTSLAGVLCIPCPSGSYAPSAGSPMCYACAAGYVSAPAGEACYLQATPKKGGKRRLRSDVDGEIETDMEEEAESMFSF
jgi:Tyrosine-protein kinase ephrin type A/B receptor-like